MGQWVFDRFVIASGKSHLFLFTLSAASITNIILDPIFIFTLNLGTKCAAIATVIGQCVGAFAGVLAGFAVTLKLLPTISGSLPDWKSMILPVISLSFYYICYVAKLMRTSMLDAIHQDYMRTAKAKGVRTNMLIHKHALRNSLIPVITYLGPVCAGIITGSFVVESTFSIPGLGKYFVQCVMSRDYPIIMATTVVLSALVIFMNLVVDIAYKIVDPRITLTGKED